MKTRFLQLILLLIVFKLCLLVEPCLRAASSVAAPKIEFRDGVDVFLSWEANDVELESSRAIGATAVWEPVLEPATTVNGLRVLRLKPGSGPRFFRLRASNVPVLNLHVIEGTQLQLSWQSTGLPFVLESADQLQPGGWRQVGQTPALANNRYSVSVTAQPATRFFRLRKQSQAVTLTLRLATDTGISSSDRITSIASVTGTAVPRAAVVTLEAGFDGVPPSQYSDVTNALAASGDLTLSSSHLEDVYGTALPDGTHTLHLLATDADANVVGSADLVFRLDTTAPRVVLTPGDGQQDVLPGQLVVATFDEPVLNADGRPAASFPLETLTVSSLGGRLPGRLVAEETGRRLSFVPGADLAGNSTFDAAFNATNIVDRAGNVAVALSARARFRTANSQGIPGTSITGWVFNSVRNDQGGESPIAGAKVKVLNGGGAGAVTDANGKFTLQNVPGGKLLIEVDGHTVKTAPGTFFPTVAKLFESIPAANTIIDAPIYLPLVQDADFVKLSTTSTTTVGNATQLPGWSLEVPPNTVQRRDGSPAGRVLISPVPPNRLPAPLPAGVDPSIVITIQTEGGADVFTQPVPLTAPNLEGLPPGAKTVLWDFDHARGEFVPVATATVSADGKTLTTDPGQGVLRPEWHFIREILDGWMDYVYAPPPNKTGSAADKFRNLRDRVALDMASVLFDIAGFIPGYGIIISGVGSAATSYLRDGLANQKQTSSTLRAGVVLGITAAGNLTGPDGRALGDAANATRARRFQDAGLKIPVGKLALNVAGKILGGLSLLNDGKNLFDDRNKFAEAINDPPGDIYSQLIEGGQAVIDSGEDYSSSLASSIENFLNGLALGLEVVEKMDALPPDTVLSPAQEAEVRALLTEAIASFDRASSIAAGPDLAREAMVFEQSLNSYMPLVSTAIPERVYYSFELGGSVVGAGVALGGSFRISAEAQVSGIVTVVEPVHGWIGRASVEFPPLTTGIAEVKLGTVVLEPSTAPDRNGNGLPDDLDPVLGNPNRAQVAALRAGLPPDEAGLATLGIIGRLAQRTQVGPNAFIGNAYSDLIAGDRVLYGIGGSNYVEVIDISRPSAPVKVGALRSGLGVFSVARGYARGHRLALTGFGARVLDVSDPRNMRLIQSIDYTMAGTDDIAPVLGANHIVVAKGKELLSFDIDTGQQVSSVSLATLGNPIKMDLNGDLLTVLTFQDDPLQFSVTTIRFGAGGNLAFPGEVRPFFWSARLSIPNPYGLAVDDRAAYVGPWLISVDPYVPGFGTFDISDPTKPVVIATPSTNNITGAAILATDNAGHLLATVAGTQQNKVLDVYDVRDLKKTDNRILSIPLDFPPYAPAFTAGLAVFNTEESTYLARVVPIDTAGVAPTIQEIVLQTGSVAVEGRHVGVHVKVTDDAQVARVELFLQGDNLVASDATYPFDLDFLPPASLPEGQALTLTARATDTGGNRSEKSVNLTYHALAPHVASVTPIPGFTTRLPLTNGAIVFDKPLVRAVSASDFDLRAAGPDGKFDTSDDVHLQVADARFNSDNTRIDLDFGKLLPIGKYRLTAPAALLTDRGGNALDGEFTGRFPSGNGSFGGDFATTFDVLNVPELAIDALPFRGFRTDAREYSDFSIRSVTSPMLVVDVNGDGRADIVRAVFNAPGDTNVYHVIAVTLQIPDGSFTNTVTYPAPDQIVQVLAGDVNGDGKTDLVTVSFDSFAVGFPPKPQPFDVSIMLGNGDGTFQSPKPADTGGRKLREVGHFLIGNFAGHGRADLVQLIRDVVEEDSSTGNVIGRIPGEVLLYAANTDGTLTAPISTSLPQNPQASFGVFFDFAAADFNHDGKTDLLVPGQKSRHFAGLGDVSAAA